jgi:benzylsuccinate CoA-transferase BbsE subunit
VRLIVNAALDDLRVLDCADGVGGSWCGRMFADFGADVVKVEPTGGSPLRRQRRVEGASVGALFAWTNANKRGVVLDLATAQGQARVLELARAADVLIEDFAPAVRGDDGLVREAMAANPRLVVVSITDFGLDGPDAGRAGSHLVLNGLAGMSLINTYEGRAYPEPSEHLYTQAGIQGYIAALAALHARDAGAPGQRIDLSVLQVAVAVSTPMLTQHFTGTLPRRAAQPLLACKDGYVFVLPVQQRAWEALQIGLGLPDELARDPRYATPFLRQQNQRALLEALAPYLARFTRRELFELLSTLRAIVGMALQPEELPEDAHLRERQFFVTLDDPDGTPITYPGPPFRSQTMPWRLVRPAPSPGQHNDDVVAQWPAGTNHAAP